MHDDGEAGMHEQFMQAALEQAEEALSVSEVPIGCVIVDENNTIVAKGRNRTNESRNATRHAEFEALDILLHLEKDSDESSLRQRMSCLRLYVTVEPCIMCAAALRRVGLTRVFFGCFNERFGGCGSIVEMHAGIVDDAVDSVLTAVQLRQYRKACVELLRKFYIRENDRAPVPRKKAKRILKPVED